jgi:acyl carrier protein phosphodiesterase
MNYLAHIALSGEKTDIMIGNFIGDFIKGNDYNNYPKDLKKGMLLHRAIDSFTDNHPLTIQSKRRFYSEYPKVGGIITDIIYDYFLCQQWNKFYSIELNDFIANTYTTLKHNKNKFPKEMDYLYQHLIKNDWFQRYQTQEGTALTLTEIGKRLKYPKDLGFAFNIVNDNFSSFDDEFSEFYKELMNFCTRFLDEN